MRNENDTLPENLKSLIKTLSTQQAIPLGQMSELPFVAVKVDEADERLIEEGSISCEMKPSIFNVEFDGHVIGICCVQFRLNRNDDFIYTAMYDLRNEKQFDDCYALLNMKNYGLFVASTHIHDFVSFDMVFEGTFSPQAILEYAKEQSSEYPPELFAEIAYGFNAQAETPRALWDFLDGLASYDNKWYGRIQLNKDL